MIQYNKTGNTLLYCIVSYFVISYHDTSFNFILSYHILDNFIIFLYYNIFTSLFNFILILLISSEYNKLSHKIYLFRYFLPFCRIVKFFISTKSIVIIIIIAIIITIITIVITILLFGTIVKNACNLEIFMKITF